MDHPCFPSPSVSMDVLANHSIFQELQLVHDTGYFSAMPSLEENWQQVGSRLNFESQQPRRASSAAERLPSRLSLIRAHTRSGGCKASTFFYPPERADVRSSGTNEEGKRFFYHS